MKYSIYLIITLFTLLSCKKNNSNAVYNLDQKSRNVILYGNLKHIKDQKVRELFEIGLENIENENYKKAQQYFLRANEIEANNIDILNCLANIESSLGNNQKSIKMLYKLISIDSTKINTYINLGQKLMIEREYMEASKILLLGLKNKSVFNSHQEAVLLTNLAISFNNLDECNEGLKYANRALLISQNNEFRKFTNQIIGESENCK